MSTKAAAAELGIVPLTLYGLIDRGELPAYRFGRVIRLRADDVTDFIQASHIEPGSLRHLYPPGDTAGHESEDLDEPGEDDDGSES